MLARTEIHRWVRLLALIVFVISLPFANKVLFVANNISVMLLVVNWLLESKFLQKWQQIKSNRLLWPFILYYVVYAISLLYTDDLSIGGFVLEKKLNLIVLPLVIFTGVEMVMKDIRKVLSGFVLSMLVASFVCIVVAVQKNLLEGHTPSYIYNAVMHDIHLPGRYLYFNYWYFTNQLFVLPIKMHAIYFAMMLIVSSALSIWLWWEGNTKRKVFLVLLILFNFLFIVLLSSRTQLFCASILLLLFILYEARRKKRLVLGFVFLGFITLAAIAIVMTNPIIRERIIQSNLPGTHYTENKFGEGGLSLRLYKWQYAMETIRAQWLFGSGAGDSQRDLELIYAKHNFEIGLENHFNPHNQYLQSALDIGLLGFVAFLILLGVPIVYALRVGNGLLLTFMLVFAISCLTESMLEVNKGISAFGFFASFFAGKFFTLHQKGI